MYKKDLNMSTNVACTICENNERYQISSFISLHKDTFLLEKGKYYTININYIAPNTSIVYQSKYGKWEYLDNIPDKPLKFKAHLQHGVFPTVIAKRLCNYGIGDKLVKFYNNFIDSDKYMKNKFNKNYIRVQWQFLN